MKFLYISCFCFVYVYISYICIVILNFPLITIIRFLKNGKFHKSQIPTLEVFWEKLPFLSVACKNERRQNTF